jgi:cell wall-associated NlpC family hydrolase
MRRLTIILSAAISAVVLVSFVSLAAGAQAAAKPRVSSADDSPSQGTFTEGRAGPNEPSLVDGTGPTAAESNELSVAAQGRPSSRDVVQAARSYIGTSYKYATCTNGRMSCTCLTKSTWAKFGHSLPMNERDQWKYEPARKVARGDLRPGDIVFFKEAGRNKPITHVGIYSGRGNLVHASRYFGKVVESKMSYIDGYSGARKLRPR